jgi:hypothetical protein
MKFQTQRKVEYTGDMVLFSHAVWNLVADMITYYHEYGKYVSQIWTFSYREVFYRLL